MQFLQKEASSAKEPRKKHRFTIRAKIMLLSVAVAMTPLLLSSGISASISMKNGMESAYTLVEDRTDNIASQVGDYVEEGYSVVETLAYSKDIRGMNPPEQVSVLREAADKNDALILLFEQNLEGMQVARSSGELGSRADRWWFKQEMQTKQPFVTKSYYSASTGEAVTSIIFPVFENSGSNNLIEILGADFSLAELQNIVDAYNTEDIYTIILDGEGSVIAHIDQTEVTDIYNYLTCTKTLQNNGTEESVPVEIPIELQEAAQAVLNGESNTVEISSSAESEMAGHILSYAPVEIPGDSDNWGVITVEKTSAAYASTYQLIRSILILTLVMIAAVILIAMFFARTLTRPLRKLSDAAEKIADGDLNVVLNAQSNDEIGDVSHAMSKTVVRLQSYIDYINEITQVLNQIANGNLHFELKYDYAGEFSKIKDALFLIHTTLSETISEIKAVANTVNQASNQLSNGSQMLAQGNTEQAASVEELSASIAQISEHIKDTAKNAVEAEQVSVRSGEVVEKGNQQMREMMQAMEDISKSSKGIENIIKTIDDIAFQTNILALNAAVEAARAGAAGKGFAVVADEVRNLAQKSAEAAKNTTDLIQHSISTVNIGSQIAADTAESLRTIVENSEQMLALVREISINSTEQSTAVSQVTIGVDQVSQVIQMTSVTANETASASGNLAGQADHLQSLVNQFILDDEDNTLQ